MHKKEFTHTWRIGTRQRRRRPRRCCPPRCAASLRQRSARGVNTPDITCYRFHDPGHVVRFSTAGTMVALRRAVAARVSLAEPRLRRWTAERVDFDWPLSSTDAPWLRGAACGPWLARTKAASASRPRTGAKCACANTCVGCRNPPPRPLTIRCSGSSGYASAASLSWDTKVHDFKLDYLTSRMQEAPAQAVIDQVLRVERVGVRRLALVRAVRCVIPGLKGDISGAGSRRQAL